MDVGSQELAGYVRLWTCVHLYSFTLCSFIFTCGGSLQDSMNLRIRERGGARGSEREGESCSSVLEVKPSHPPSWKGLLCLFSGEGKAENGKTQEGESFFFT